MSNVKGDHQVQYAILRQHPGESLRTIEVHATENELRQLAEQGYLLREGAFNGERLERLRIALDRLETLERNSSHSGEGTSTNRQFGGIFLRYLMDKDEAFLDFLHHQPFLSIARAMMGPQVQMSMSARIAYPSTENQETHWHQHLRYIPKPLPVWFTRPHCMDVLVYLDDANEANGPICVVPGTHNRLDVEPDPDCYDDLPGQVELQPKAGSALLMHANLWHRAKPTTPSGTKRRLLLLAYYPTWLKRGRYGVKPELGLTDAFLEAGDEETLELLGREGYM